MSEATAAKSYCYRLRALEQWNGKEEDRGVLTTDDLQRAQDELPKLRLKSAPRRLELIITIDEEGNNYDKLFDEETIAAAQRCARDQGGYTTPETLADCEKARVVSFKLTPKTATGGSPPIEIEGWAWDDHTIRLASSLRFERDQKELLIVGEIENINKNKKIEVNLRVGLDIYD